MWIFSLQKGLKSKILTRVVLGQASDPTRSGLFESDSDSRPPRLADKKLHEMVAVVAVVAAVAVAAAAAAAAAAAKNTQWGGSSTK